MRIRTLVLSLVVVAGCAAPYARDEDTSKDDSFTSPSTAGAPAAPKELTIASSSASAIALAWTAGDAKAKTFRVWRGDASFESWELVGETETASFVDQTVKAGVKYSYGVRAMDAKGRTSDGSNVVLVTAAPGCADCNVPGGGAAPVTEGTADRPFPKATWLYDAIGNAPRVDPESAAMLKNLNSGAHGIALNEFAIPFYAADATTPKKAITCTQQGWGDCAYVKSGLRPMTAAFTPHTGSDGAMVVIDTSPRTGPLQGRTVDEYWQFAWNAGAPSTTWGFISDLDGDGLKSQATGSGISRAAGIVRAKEIAAGLVEHALVFSTSFCKTAAFRFPAWKDDGKYAGAGGAPEGIRVQIDPALSPDAYGLNKAERAIMIALQKYGAYNIDCGGAPMAFSFEEVPGNPGSPYAESGLAYDYYDLAKLPWDKARVLASWNGM